MPFPPTHAIKKRDAWIERLHKESTWEENTRTLQDRGDILIFLHGYNNPQEIVIQQHRQLKTDLAAAGWEGASSTPLYIE